MRDLICFDATVFLRHQNFPSANVRRYITVVYLQVIWLGYKKDLKFEETSSHRVSCEIKTPLTRED